MAVVQFLVVRRQRESMNKILKILSCSAMAIGAFGLEIRQRFYSSPFPEPKLGRIVAVSGIHDDTIYVTTEMDRLVWVWFALTMITFLTWVFWPTKKTDHDAA